MPLLVCGSRWEHVSLVACRPDTVLHAVKKKTKNTCSGPQNHPPPHTLAASKIAVRFFTDSPIQHRCAREQQGRRWRKSEQGELYASQG